MKPTIAFIVLLLLACPGIVLAAWTDDFLKDFQKFGIDLAVENALDDDVTPEEILTFILSNKEINDKATLKALYCAGVDRDAVREAALKLGVPEEELARALEESIAECGAKLVLDDRENSGITASPSRPVPLPPPPVPQGFASPPPVIPPPARP